jgi:2-phospho-L-lactate guanylyltransferase
MLVEQRKSRPIDEYPVEMDTPSIWVIIPVKPLRQSKTRLAHILSTEQRAELIASFLCHHLDVLKQVADIDRVLVVSSDATVLATARQRGAVVLDEGPVQGLNAAAGRAVAMATANRASAVLLLPVDLPLIQVEDVVQMIEVGLSPGDNERPVMSICPDVKQQGTNALFLSLPTHFNFHYGEGSFQRHLHEAVQLGLIPHIVRLPRLELDIDLENDWSRYQQLISEQDPTPGLVSRDL